MFENKKIHSVWVEAEGNQLATNRSQLKMPAEDGKMRLTDVASTEQLLRIIQPAPSPKAEPFKLWLARVGAERIEVAEVEQAKKGGTEI
ncbi:BRO family protein [uncultured Cloacibacillus sp.]|uniref:BRO family protein n=1 Tax=uncultured Cloacibacillus sp. TaxID=889794 RepID=UPI0027D98B9D|nr:BRO family protein [uncultured Cloacibacillus sp.]